MDPYSCFQQYFRYWLGRRLDDDERQIARWKGTVSRFKGKLVKLIKDVNGTFDSYSISPMIRQAYCIGAIKYLKMIYYNIFFVHIKMSYYQLNRDKLFQKSKRQIS